jgi:hypothetical protein
VSRLYDRVTRRASPGLDTDLSGLGLGFIYPGNVRFSRNTLPMSSILAFSTRHILESGPHAKPEIHSDGEMQTVDRENPTRAEKQEHIIEPNHSYGINR